MTAPDYGRSFAIWRAAAAEDWQDYTHHAFVEGLRDGGRWIDPLEAVVCEGQRLEERRAYTERMN